MKKENLLHIKKAMEYPEVVKLVSEASDRIWHKLNDVTSFEYTCYRNIGIALSKMKVKSVGGVASRVIARAEAWYMKYRKREEITSLEALAGLDEEGNESPIDIVDVLADVENEVVDKDFINKKVALLAEDDSRRLAILKAWAYDEISDVKLAKVLAGTFTKTAETGHRRFIQRFRTECQRRLAGAI